MWKTRVTDILGIEYPILEGGMAIAGNGELAAAVSNGGGLGMVSSNPGWAPIEKRTENVREHVRRARALTDKPFGINFPIFILSDYADQHLEMALEEGVRIVAQSGGSPKLHTRKFKDAGLTVMHVVGTVKQALAAQDSGVDIIIAEGYEAGGVNSPDEVTSMVLTPSVVDAVDVPVVTAGGIADARGFVAAMALGAEGVQMGSAFLASRECHVHDRFKDAIVAAKETDTLITQRAIGRLSRSLKNPFTLKILEFDKKAAVDEMKDFLGQAMEQGSKTNTPTIDVQYEGQMRGDIQNGEAALGQTAGLIKQIRSASEVVRAIVEGAAPIIDRWQMVSAGEQPGSGVLPGRAQG